MELHSKIAMEGLARGKKRLQHNIVDLFPGTPTDLADEASTMHGRTHTLTKTQQMTTSFQERNAKLLSEMRENHAECVSVEKQSTGVLQKSWS